jgi:hypothetical protein
MLFPCELLLNAQVGMAYVFASNPRGVGDSASLLFPLLFFGSKQFFPQSHKLFSW